MTPDAQQLNLLIKSFEGLQKKVPTKHLFIAGNQTYAISDFRRAADKAGGEVGAALHVLIDALESRNDAFWLEHVQQQQAIIDDLRGSASLARTRITRVMKVAVTKRQTHIYQTLKEARDELTPTK